MEMLLAILWSSLTSVGAHLCMRPLWVDTPGRPYLVSVCPQAQSEIIKVRGAAEDTAGAPVAGVRWEFLLSGSPEKKSAVTGADGKYSLALPAGAYEILLYLPGQTRPHSAMAWLAGREEVVINARVPKERVTPGVGSPGHLEYDFLGEWRVVDERGRGVGPARVTLEALQRDARRARFPVHVPAADDEKETDGQLETAPDGRFVFRIRESHLLPEKVVALVVTVEMPGFLPQSVRVFPVLQFSETGHLFAAYPEEDVEIRLKRKP